MESPGGSGRPPFGDDDPAFDTDEPLFEEGTSPYETGEAPAPPSPPDTGEEVAPRPAPQRTPAHRRPSPRRGRHRDLPARVRRRQAIAVLVIAGLVVIGILALVSGGGGSDEPSVSELPVSKLVGQTVIGRLGQSGPDKKLLARVRNGEIGGFVAFPAENGAKKLQKQVTALQKAAAEGDNPPLLIAIDQEGGPVKRLAGPPNSSPAEMGQSEDTGPTTDEGKATGEYLAGLGVNVDLAPVADVSQPNAPETVSSRTFGSDPDQVADHVAAFVDGLSDGGTAATAKHFPGLGYAGANTDFEAVTITTSRERLEADLVPFSAAIDAGVQLVMMSNAKYPTLDDSKQPATWSQALIGDELRGQLGFEGVVITDDLESDAVQSELAPNKAALRSLLAGADLVMFATGEGASASAYKSLLKQATAGKPSRAQLEDAYERITTLKDTFD